MSPGETNIMSILCHKMEGCQPWHIEDSLLCGDPKVKGLFTQTEVCSMGGAGVETWQGNATVAIVARIPGSLVPSSGWRIFGIDLCEGCGISGNTGIIRGVSALASQQLTLRG